ncbi:MAG: quaternary ammonium transporter [Chloroflexia bacterium]|nr:quaternary ammonium transporter [Chloroflexia bacterium]
MVTRRTVVKGLAVTPVAGAALFAVPVHVLGQDTVAIGSKNFTEQLILGEMYAQRLEALGLPVSTSLNLGGTAVAHEALVAGEISLYPEYTGTALTVILEIPIASVQATPEAGAATIDEQVYQLVADGYLDQFDLVWLDETPFNNTQALAVKRAFAEEQGISTISELAAIAGDLTIVAPSDFVERPDGLLGLQEFYGMEFGEVLSVEPGIRYQALQEDQAEVVLAFGTDGQVAGFDLVLLEDDLSLWPPYHVAPVVRQDVLDAYPELADALNEIAPLLTDEVMAELNWRVDGDAGEEPADVARSFLEENGLLGE